MVEQPKLGIILEERVVKPSVPGQKGQVNFDCGSWHGPLKTSLLTIWELMKPSWCPHPNAGLIWDMTADVTLDLEDDTSSAGPENNKAEEQTIHGTSRG